MPEIAPPPTTLNRNRRPTEVIDAIIEETLNGEQIANLVKNLSESERELLDSFIETIREDPSYDQLRDLWSVDYVKPPPSINEFIMDDYWLGQRMRPSETNQGIFPIWQEVLEKDWDLHSRVSNVVFTGSLGIGKTWVMSCIFLYRIALARLLRNPQFFFGLTFGSSVFYAVLSLSKAVVRDTVFTEITTSMGASAFFMEECYFNPDKKYSDNKIELGNHIVFTAGSKGWHVIGRNVMGVCLDEGNWRLESSPDEKAYALYDEVRTRIKNRFQKFSGFLPAVSILSSSARDETSFTERVIDEIKESGDTETAKIYAYPVFVVKRHLIKYDKLWFRVQYGLRNEEPCILEGWYLEDGTPCDEDGNTDIEVTNATHEECSPGAESILVPKDYHDDFARNCRVNLQSLAGISSGGSHRLFPNMVHMERCIELSEAEGIVNPCKNTFIPISHDDDKNVWDYLDHKSFLMRHHSSIRPIRHPGELRFAHLDLAKTGIAGLAICHRAGMQMVKDYKDGEPFEEQRLIVEYDFILSITPGKNKPISLEKIQRFFIWLRQACNFKFGLITADQYGSQMPLETLGHRGFTVDELSVDKKKGPYYAWRVGYEDLRIRMFKQHQLIREAENLIDGDKKIDHPEKFPGGAEGTKDTADAAAGAYWNAVANFKKFPQVAQNAVDPSVYSAPPTETEDKSMVQMIDTTPPAPKKPVFKA